ncbi:polysaccharide biosynthesis tyrosine autokinase [Sinorhizobium sp. BG8]|uniref:polysaccharide biosynthesis tyrosine autokinase n=1 Tax=Sinorhizobium sp. BG8 TaxID=2613773 RepID=UPI00193E8136|nr:polysaccharide biosynthesis tyrosine autokinase [Sinorhizobium sp. BG8]QRM56449.1 polysaccharide biosynthesis tyrosine autokinase [Sinorhizobium sp. BG8]
MLQINNSRMAPPATGLWASDASPVSPIDFDKGIAAMRRQWPIVAACTLAAGLLGLIYVIAAIPLYTTRTSILIDRQYGAAIQQLSGSAGLLDEEVSVLSQIELLKSEAIGLAVVNRLHLADETAAAPSNMFLALNRWIFGTTGNPAKRPAADEGEGRRRAALETIRANMAVTRAGRSRVLEISYVSPSPELSQRVAAAIADAYLADRISSRYEATRQASDWLLARMEELKQRAVSSDLSVQKFRTEHGLVATNVEGRLVSDQQLTELNSALIEARAAAAQAAARYERIQTLIAGNREEAVVAEVLGGTISNTLREKYLSAAKREAEILARLGAGHVQVQRLRGEMEEYRRQMFDELLRIAQGNRSELDIARSRVQSLTESVAQATLVSASAKENEVQLRELERESETYRNVYEAFLRRYQEAVQQQSFPVADARIISRAVVPDRPSHPKKMLVIPLALLIGAGAGAFAGAYREYRERSFRTGSDVRQALDLPFIGGIPLLKAEDEKPSADGLSFHPRSVRKANAMVDHVIDHPFSRFTETLRGTRIAVDLALPGKAAKIIGIISLLPAEGRSTIAINLAELLAAEGARTLLIDADLRNAGATKVIGEHATAGLGEALVDERSIRDLLLVNPKTRLAFLPATAGPLGSRSSVLLASSRMNHLLEQASASFDYIVLDLPPLAPVADARAVAPHVNAFVLVAEWGRTNRYALQEALFSDRSIAAKCVGAILSKIDPDKAKLYSTASDFEM